MPSSIAEKPAGRELSVPPRFDPFKAYFIVAHNRDFTGESNGVHFAKGVARIDALPAGAPEERQQRRLERLAWFENAHPYREQVVGENGRVKWVTHPTYTIQTEKPPVSGDEIDDEEF